jgi:hypothetical protein
MGGVVWVWLALAASTACSGHDVTRANPPPVQQAPGDVGGKTVMFIEIEGTLPELAALKGIDGLELERGASDIGGGRHRIGAMVTRKGALLDVQARGLKTRIVMDEAEAERRMQVEREEIERAGDAGAAVQQTPPKPKAD